MLHDENDEFESFTDDLDQPLDDQVEEDTGCGLDEGEDDDLLDKASSEEALEQEIEKLEEKSTHGKPDVDISKLSREECIALNPDFGKDQTTLILENEKFAYKIVHTEYGKYPYPVKDDLLSGARYGLAYAASKYNSNQVKTKFISYAVHWIRYYIHETIRDLNPIKLNQNFITKRNKVLNAISAWKSEHNDEEPTPEQISKTVGLSPKVVRNILKINNGENFKFSSFQAMVNPANVKSGDDLDLENKLMYEYVTTASIPNPMIQLEFNDALEEFKKKVSEKDYNMFIDKHLNGLSFSDIAKKYQMNFASSVSYSLKKIEKIWKQTLEE